MRPNQSKLFQLGLMLYLMNNVHISSKMDVNGRGRGDNNLTGRD
jgi:hypothetical protein